MRGKERLKERGGFQGYRLACRKTFEYFFKVPVAGLSIELWLVATSTYGY
jgi:hypothetical protein